MKGYKAFNGNLKCRKYQYKLDQVHVLQKKPKLGVKGFHFCTVLEDIINYYCDPTMRVFEIEASGIITDAEDDCSKRACSEIKLVKELSLYEVAQSIKTPLLAHWWAMWIGDRDIMINLITDSENAYKWARDIGNQDVMIDRIIDSEWAYLWARDIGNQDVIINKITDSEWAYKWARDIGNQDVMIDRIIDSEYAYEWARNIGNKDVMIGRVIDSEWAYWWAIDIGNQDIMIDKISNSYWGYRWARDIGNKDVMIDRVIESHSIEIWISIWPQDKQYFINKGLIG